MKKFLLTMVAGLLALNMQAQMIQRTHIVADKAPVALSMENTGARASELASNQFLCGLYTSDDLAEYGSGLGRYTSGACKAVTPFEPELLKSFEGFKVVGMRIGLCAAVTSDFGLYIGKLGTASIEDFRTKAVGTGSKGWNTIMLDEDEQFTLSAAETLMVGYTYYQQKGSTDACYPISYYEGSTKKGTFYFYGNIPTSSGGSGLDWYNLGADGALSVQLIVEGELTDENTIVEAVSTTAYLKKGESATATVKIANMGKNAINKIAFDYYIDEVLLGNTECQVNAIEATQEGSVNFAIAIDPSLEAGSHTLKVELTKVNGEQTTSQNKVATTNFTAYSDVVARQKHLIEHFTSWTCTYCHLGYKLLRYMERNNDNIAWVALHGNMSSQKDPYYLSEVDQVMGYLGANSFPSACFNRTYLSDLADADEIVYGLGYNEQYIPQVSEMIMGSLESIETPSFVTLTITPEYDSDSRLAQIEIKGTGVTDAAKLLTDNKLYIYLTESGLTGRQLSNGSWESNFEHNNTMRAVLTNVKGSDINWNGDNFTYSIRYTVPSDFAANNLSITAFIAPAPSSNLKAMGVNNCERVKLRNSTGIDGVKMQQQGQTGYYDLEGRQTMAPHRGLNIVRMSDGTTRKLIIR